MEAVRKSSFFIQNSYFIICRPLDRHRAFLHRNETSIFLDTFLQSRTSPRVAPTTLCDSAPLGYPLLVGNLYITRPTCNVRLPVLCRDSLQSSFLIDPRKEMVRRLEGVEGMTWLGATDPRSAPSSSCAIGMASTRSCPPPSLHQQLWSRPFLPPSFLW